MTGVRKSNRINSKGELVGNSMQQSRITEYVNVKKRANLATEVGKQILLENKEAKEGVSFPGTPIKIKRKAVILEKNTLQSGILTPSPSTESLGLIDSENVKVAVKPVTVPAHKRFAHLVENVRNQKPKLDVEFEEPTKCAEASSVPVKASFKAVPWLPLNEKWAFYEKLIFNVDSLCVLAAGRSQPCVFHRIQKTLENVLGKQVPIDQMERLKSLWPEAYEYRENRVIFQGRRIDSVAICVPGIGNTESSAALMNERKEQVKGRVQHYLIKAHNAELNVVDEYMIPKRWSDKFDQNSVKDLERTPLIDKCTETTDKLTVSRPGTPKLINEIIQNNVESNDSDCVSVPSAVEDVPKKMTLLERIRAKEQALQAKKCFNDPETSRIEAILSQMERFTQSVMFTFASSKKTTIFLTDLTTKLIQSSPIPLNPSEILERLKLLERSSPTWIKISDEESPTQPKYVKILEKDRSLKSIIESLKLIK